VALGVRLGWVGADDTEEAALAATLEQLRHEGEGILLILDNATDAKALSPYLPRGGAAHVLVTSNALDWRRVAEPVELRLWPQAIGADSCRLPPTRRFETAPARLLDADKDAPAEFHDGLTVAKAFALAIDEAAKLHPAAEPLIVHAALLAPEPIPLFVFSERREHFGEPLASMLADDGLDEAVAALRAFALIDREAIQDEREAAITTECIRLHRLVRQVAAARCDGAAREDMLRTLVEVLATLYPEEVFNDPRSWLRARRLDALALALVGGNAGPRTGTEAQATDLLDRLTAYRHGVLAAYTQAPLSCCSVIFTYSEARCIGSGENAERPVRSYPSDCALPHIIS
jgi:hypothetical protein